ncbi:hypothetical protein HaLaN_30652, partial [Haematococcus lacustris]
MGAGLTGL